MRESICMKRPQYISGKNEAPQWQGQLCNGFDYVITRNRQQLYIDVFNSSEGDADPAHVISEIMDDMGSALRYLKDLELQP